MVSDNQLDQYFQFVKDMLLEEVYLFSEPLIHSAKKLFELFVRVGKKTPFDTATRLLTFLLPSSFFVFLFIPTKNKNKNITELFSKQWNI